jgi:predicted GNAT family N-acyltransferase
MSEIEFRTPNSKNEFLEYDLFRWRLLREPIGKTIKSLKDDFEDFSFHLIGIKDNQIIACGRLHFNSKTEAQIRYMAVEKNFQRNGIGRKILKILEKEAKNKNAKKIVLNARDHAINFYKSSNYKVVGKYTGSDTGIPHTTMEKKI